MKTFSKTAIKTVKTPKQDKFWKRTTAQVLAAALCLGVVGGALVAPTMVWGDTTTTTTTTQNVPIPPDTTQTGFVTSITTTVTTVCSNRYTTVTTTTCDNTDDVCGGTVTPNTHVTGTAANGKCTTTSVVTPNHSYVNNQSFNYVHWGHDFKPVSAVSGCSSCGGGAAPKAGATSMGLLRKHRFRNEVESGSFGVGGFNAYTDKRLSFVQTGSGVQVTLFDPNIDVALNLFDGTNGDTALDGVYHDTVHKAVKEGHLLDANGNLTTSLAAARYFDVVAWDSQVSRFEVVATANGTTPNGGTKNGLVAQWAMDEGAGTAASDSSGLTTASSHVGTFPALPSFVPGKSGAAGDYALNFNGVNQAVVIGNPTDLNFTGQITMSAWIKPANTAGGLRSVLSHGYTSNPTTQCSIEIYNNCVFAGAYPGAHPSTWSAVALPANATSTFVHVVSTYDGVNWNTYINGVLKNSAASTAGAPQVASNWVIGAGAMPGDKRFFNGAIDDVRIYSRALTPAEVAGLTAGTEPDATGLKAKWGMDEGSGATVADATGASTHAGILAPSQPTWVAGRTGLPGDTALHFDGNGFLPIGNPADLNFGGKITMTAWAKPDAGATPFAQRPYADILTHGYPNGAAPCDFMFFYSNGYTYAGEYGGGTNYQAYAPSTASGNWAHIAGEYDGNNWRLYQNGVLTGVVPATIGSVPTTTGANWVLGAADSAHDPLNFIGTLDDVRIYNRALSDAEIYAIGGAQNVYSGRLVSITDPKGHGLTVTYKYNPATSTQDATDTQVNPDLLFQMNTSADSLGNTVTYTYAPNEVAGNYVISQASFSNGQSATYEYADGLHLTKVNHSDGSASMFSYSVSGNTTTVDINDTTADAGHEKKTASLSNQIAVYGGTPQSAQVWNQSALMCRMIRNGAGEISYLNFTDVANFGTNSNNTTVYEGGQRIKVLGAEVSERFYQAGAKVVIVNGQPTVQGTLEPWFASLPNWGTDTNRAQGTFPAMYKADGTYNTFAYDSSTYPTQKAYTDGTSEYWSYDANHNVTLYVDRAGRPVTKTYDSHNNLLTQQVGGTVNLSTMVFTPNADTGTTAYAYYPAGDANQFLLKTETDANGNATDYTYDVNHHVLTKTLPADVAGGARPVYAYEYDSAGRLTKSTDPVGRYVQYTYDVQDRVIRKDYCGVSNEQTVYGTGDNANRVIAQSDRDGNWTAYRYDADGRTATTISGIANQTDATNLAFVPDPAFHTVTDNVYLPGSSLVDHSVTNGKTTTYLYDLRNRVISQTVYSGQVDGSGNPIGLTTTTTYVNNNVFKTTDAYGRNTYYDYRPSDLKLIRKVVETVPGGAGTVPQSTWSGTMFPGVGSLTRSSTTANAPYLIEDYTLDVDGLQTAMIDARGITSQTTYDTRGRAVAQMVAVGTPVQAQAQTIYDANSNVIEQRGPRYFDSTDATGYNKAKSVMTYSGRNLLLAKTEAPTLPEAGTTTFSYYLDGKQATTVLPNGNVVGGDPTTQTVARMNRPLCGWSLGNIDQAGNGTITDTTIGGDVIHTIQVKNLRSLTTTTSAGLVIPNFLNEVSMDVPDANTISESTTQYDSKHRPIASTVWSGALGAVYRNDVPAYFGGAVKGGTNAQAAVPAGVTGQTTLYYYSENLAVSATLKHAFGPDINIQPVLDKLAGQNLNLSTLTLATGSARVTMSPTGEVTVQIMDGMGRSVISAKLDTTAP